MKKTILDEVSRPQVIHCIMKLKPDSSPLWMKMPGHGVVSIIEQP